MTHPREMRRSALASVLAGKSVRGAALEAGLPQATVQRWVRDTAGVLQAETAHIGSPIKRLLGDDALAAAETAIAAVNEMVAHARKSADPAAYLRDTAYSARVMSDIALDWLEGRKGGSVSIDASQHATVLPALTLDQARALAYRALGGEGSEQG